MMTITTLPWYVILNFFLISFFLCVCVSLCDYFLFLFLFLFLSLSFSFFFYKLCFFFSFFVYFFLFLKYNIISNIFFNQFKCYSLQQTDNSGSTALMKAAYTGQKSVCSGLYVIITSLCHHVIMSSCQHAIIMSSCHYVIMLS